MQLWQKYLTTLSAVLPAGAVGAVMLLGAALPANGTVGQANAAAAADRPGVAERLGAIRQAVFVANEAAHGMPRTDPDFQLAWGNRWNNWGWGGRPGWRNWNNFRPRWNNWRNAWRNW